MKELQTMSFSPLYSSSFSEVTGLSSVKTNTRLLKINATGTSPRYQDSISPRPNRISRYIKDWKLESVACFLVLVIPAIIFATLYPHRGQPLPNWPLKISINSFLSVYTLVLKAATGIILTSCIGQLQWTWFSRGQRPLSDVVRFDNASRGADGALVLVWTQRFRQPLATLGCFIMLLAFIVDPFIQQLAQSVSCSVELSGVNATASLPRTNVFQALGYDAAFNNNNTEDDMYQYTAQQKLLETALLNGIYSPGQGLLWHCSTGNCTFPIPYGTIALYSSCKDASADVDVKLTCSHPNSSYTSQNPTSAGDCPENSGFTVTSTFNASDYIQLNTSMTISALGAPSTPVDVAAADVNLLPEGSGVLGRVQELVVGFLIGATANSGGRIDWADPASSTCDSSEPEESWSCRGYGAAVCTIRPCVQVFNATISAGILEETLLVNSTDVTWGTIYATSGRPAYLALMDTECSDQNQTTLPQDSYTSSRWIPYNLNLTAPDAGDAGPEPVTLPSTVTSLLDNGCLYVVSVDEIFVAVEQYLSGTIQAYASSGITGATAADGIVKSLSGFEGPEVIENMYNWGHSDFERIQSIFANISTSLTTYIRTHGSVDLSGNTSVSRDAQGRVYHYATCLQVQWYWILFPALLALLTAVFFGAVVEATGRHNTPVWKTSPLAWILKSSNAAGEQGNEGQVSSHAVGGNSRDMKETSKQIFVQIYQEDKTWIEMTDIKDPNLMNRQE